MSVAFVAVCSDCKREFLTNRALRTHQGLVHGTPWGEEPKLRGGRRRRCKCVCGVTHVRLTQIIGFKRVPMLDRFTGRPVPDPETGKPIEIFDPMRSLGPQVAVPRKGGIPGLRRIMRDGRMVEVGFFQELSPPIDRPGVRCVCPYCGHMHLRKLQQKH